MQNRIIFKPGASPGRVCPGALTPEDVGVGRYQAQPHVLHNQDSFDPIVPDFRRACLGKPVVFMIRRFAFDENSLRFVRNMA
ncbi:hypothetical protein ACSQ76_10300 [Roseovarius sp. B08]|uniref:hypothetical protein n=1 Tax=Roseovarius sp. B08 TaxID=3449223 RepID=UPI003EDC4D01